MMHRSGLINNGQVVFQDLLVFTLIHNHRLIVRLMIWVICKHFQANDLFRKNMWSSLDETFNIQICHGIVWDISGEPPLPVLTLIHNGPAGTALESLAVA